MSRAPDLKSPYLSYNIVQSEVSDGSNSPKDSLVCLVHSHSQTPVLCLGQPMGVLHCKASLSYLRKTSV